MPSDRVTVSLDEDAEEALEGLTDQTDENRSELIRKAITFYAANFDSANASDSDHLQTYYEMLPTDEHIILDTDYLHVRSSHVDDSGEGNSEFIDTVDRVAQYHATSSAGSRDSRRSRASVRRCGAS